jgi:hypothetical protein
MAGKPIQFRLATLLWLVVLQRSSAVRSATAAESIASQAQDLHYATHAGS